MQRRLKKYGRDESTLAAVSNRQLTQTSFLILATIHDYRIIPTSLLTRLVAGHEKNIYRHLQQLYHKGLVNRFAFVRGNNPGEFHYYLDNPVALDLLLNQGVDPESLDREAVRRNKEKNYCAVNNPKVAEDMQGRLLFLKHEVMITRFHAMLELACGASNGEVELTEFQQGPVLKHRVDVPKIVFRNNAWHELEETERLTHWPDAFFTLSFPNDDREPLHFFYEADRHRTNTKKYNIKLRVHFHFAVKQKELLKETYGLNRIRAVLTETIDDEWAERLRSASRHPIVSGAKPSPLFWFTTSRLFTSEQQAENRILPTFLSNPEIVFARLWATPVDDTLHSLIN